VDVYITLNTHLFRPIPKSGLGRKQQITYYYNIPSISVFYRSIIIYCRSFQSNSETIHNIINVKKKLQSSFVRNTCYSYAKVIQDRRFFGRLPLPFHFSNFFFYNNNNNNNIINVLVYCSNQKIQELYSISFYCSGNIKINNRHLIKFIIT